MRTPIPTAILTLACGVLMSAAGVAEAAGLQAAAARSKQTKLPLLVVGSSDG